MSLRAPLVSLRMRLLLLVLMAVLPALGLVSYTAGEERRILEANVRADALRVARLAADKQDQFIEGARQLLFGLAQLPEVRRGDSAACSTLFAGLLQEYPRYANFGATRPNGDIFCSALPMNAPVNAADRAFFQRASETQAFAVGDYQIGRITGKATVNFGLPVLDPSGQLQAVVFAALDLAWLNQLAAEAELPEGAALTVIDRGATVLARYPDGGEWVGQALPNEPLIATILSQRQGVAEVEGFDGVSRLYAFVPLGGDAQYAAAYFSIGLNKDAAFGEVNRVVVRSLVGLGFVGLLALVAAWVIGDWFVLRQVKALLSATRRLGEGDLQARAGLPYEGGELSELARAFDDMASSLEVAQQRRRHEEELRRQNYELEQQNRGIREANRLKGEFVSTVSHEMRTPLTSIQGYVELLLEGNAGRLNDEQRDFLDIVDRNAGQLIALINDLLDLSRIEAGRIELHAKALDLAPIVKGVAVSLRPMIASKEQHLSVVLASDLPAAWADADRVTQIVTNLVANAHKYTPPGGTILVSASGQADEIRVYIHDSGVGLSAEQQAQLFTRFFRARHEATQESDGTGLGLAITRSLIELQGGSIFVSSTPGQGSTFSFTLPAAVQKPGLPSASFDRVSKSGRA